MKLVYVVAFAAVIGMGYARRSLQAPAPAPPMNMKYTLACSSDSDLSASCAQSRRLQIKQDAAHIARDAYQSLSQAAQQAQQDFAAKLKDLQDEAMKVKVENKWPTTVQFDPNTLTFSDAPPPSSPARTPPVPAPAPTKKP